MVREFWITSRVGPENSRSRPRSMVTLATIETITAGSTAITENRPTIWTCSRAAARPRRLACTIWTISRTMIPTRSRMGTPVIIRKERTTWRVGSIGVSPVSTTKVRKADNSAIPTANGASHRRKEIPLRSASSGSKDAAEVSALVIPARCVETVIVPDSGLMHSYHIVAELRQFHGAFCRAHQRSGSMRRIAGQCGPARPEMGYAGRGPASRSAPGAAHSVQLLINAWISEGRDTGSPDRPRPRSGPAAIDLNIEVPDLLAQRIAVQSQQIGRADLVAAGGCQRCGQQRHLDFLEDAVVEARRRHAVGKAREVRRQIGFDRAAEIVDAVRGVAA